jgi:hypothetical protein
MDRATVFNFVKHEIPTTVLPLATDYSIISCTGLESNYSNIRNFLADIRGLLRKMSDTPNWSVWDKVYIIFPCETLQMFQVMMLIVALTNANSQPILWMEISESRGVYVDVGEFYAEGLDWFMHLQEHTHE